MVKTYHDASWRLATAAMPPAVANPNPSRASRSAAAPAAAAPAAAPTSELPLAVASAAAPLARAPAPAAPLARAPAPAAPLAQAAAPAAVFGIMPVRAIGLQHEPQSRAAASAAERNWSVYGQIHTQTMAHRTADKLVYCHETMHTQLRMQNAGWSADVEPWEGELG